MSYGYCKSARIPPDAPKTPEGAKRACEEAIHELVSRRKDGPCRICMKCGRRYGKIPPHKHATLCGKCFKDLREKYEEAPGMSTRALIVALLDCDLDVPVRLYAGETNYVINEVSNMGAPFLELREVGA